jgi:GH25 family lysozyme M1 (1,4-beta-N-acetylmuramidase)
MTETTTVFLPLIMNDWKVLEESVTYTLGIDVSKWQDNNSTAQQMNFTKSVAMGAKFVFIKSSQALWTDEDILYNWKSAKQAGLLRGAYHFLDWVANPKAQAQYAWSIIQNDPGELPPVVDFNRLREVINLTLRIQSLQDKILAKLELYPNTLVLRISPS